MTAVFYVTCIRLCIIFSRLTVNRPRQRNYRSLLLLTINTRKMVTREKIGIGKLQLREILSPGRERRIWASNAGASRVIREVSHVCQRYFKGQFFKQKKQKKGKERRYNHKTSEFVLYPH